MSKGDLESALALNKPDILLFDSAVTLGDILTRLISRSGDAKSANKIELIDGNTRAI